MLVIREAQMAVLEQAVIRTFENRMLEHLEEFFPKHCAILGAEQVRKVIRLGLAQARQYGLVSERDVHLYVGLMFMLGSYFDRDPQLPWAAKILTDDDIVDPNARADRLHDRAMAYLNQTAGNESQYLERALRKMRELPASAWARTGEDKQLSFGDYMLKLLHSLYFEKYDAIGDPVARQFVRQGYQAARNYNLTSEAGMAIYIGLMFVLGSDFDRDPQHPWAEVVLGDASLTDSVRKGESLYQSAMAYLDKWLA